MRHAVLRHGLFYCVVLRDGFFWGCVLFCFFKHHAIRVCIPDVTGQILFLLSIYHIYWRIAPHVIQTDGWLK